ncbi:MAG: class I SAM-dependent methyltransferase [Epsilonproteobacteria bacterium]|nr:MAG: class I SAM-dependent methyltransferase [Campylobacterota bacterium]
MKKDLFSHKASKYEQNKNRVQNVKNIARAITKSINFNNSMEIMDFGSGTGLLLEQIAPFVKKITAVDMSPSMNEQLKNKKDMIGCELDILQIDLSKEKPKQKFDAIISSMTIHHIKDTKKLLNDFYDMLNKNGAIALADLETEDGSFHTEDTGVFHFGFDKKEIQKLTKQVGFKNVAIQTVSVAKKPYGDYAIFLLTGVK